MLSMPSGADMCRHLEILERLEIQIFFLLSQCELYTERLMATNQCRYHLTIEKKENK